MAKLTCLSSMASKQVLLALFERLRRDQQIDVELTAIGGVDALKRVQAGETWDLVVLADKAVSALAEQGHGIAGTLTHLFNSDIFVAVPAGGATKPSISSANEVKLAVQMANTVGYSTGPSGVYLEKLFASWELAQMVSSKLVVAPPGIPVARLISEEKVSLGFQQLSELVNVPGVEILGPLPKEIQLTTTFSGIVCARCADPALAQRVLRFLASPECDEIKVACGMVAA